MDPSVARPSASELTLTELLRRSAVRVPTAPAFQLADDSRSYGAFYGRAESLASALKTRGVQAGDRVAVWMHNSIEMLESIFAIQMLGAAAVPINFRLRTEEVTFILNDVEAVGAIVDQELFSEYSDALTLPWLLIYSGDSDSSFEDAIRSGATDGPALDVVVDDRMPAFVMYTSGTTGRPKGAVLSHRNLMANTWNWTFEVAIERGDIYLSGFPLFHIGGLVGLYPFLAMGALSVLQSSGGFDPQTSLDLQKRSGATICAYVPAQWQLIVDQSQARDCLSGSRRALWGASPASSALLEKMGETLPPMTIISTFGQTEISANATFLGTADAQRKQGSVGRLVQTLEHRIVDEDDQDVAIGEVGEIVYRGPTVMAGYHNRPEANAESFRGGWFHSGDLVREDEEGYVYVIERKDDMIISGAENVYPAEIEGVLGDHPAIRESAVVGIADPKWGQTPVAYVVRNPDADITEEQIISYLEGRLASYKKPSQVVFIDELPRNASGKILKRLLRESSKKES